MGIMNQIVRDLALHIRPEGHHEPVVRDLAYHISPQGYHEPNSP